ncbi:DUF4878 domain-containing protein [Gordonia sp. VNK1]|jgi:hypothetical protein|uniref:DUF4878 domain-containing protein n=1 Tax=Gordonia oleivorans TaxID=3156618 RepID=UPI0032B5CDB9
MNLRKSVAAAVLAGAAVFTVAACSSDDSSSSATSTAASSVAESTSESAAPAPADLDAAQAQVILRKALDPNTSSDDLDAVVDVSSPVTKPALQAYTKGASAAGYGPEVYTVKSVSADGTDKAAATVSVASPHAPQPVDITLAFVKVDGTWKLAGSAVTQLTSMMGQHGG